MKRITVISLASLCLATLAGAQGMKMQGMKMDSRYAGPVYSGAPMLNVTAALVMAGGGPAHFSTGAAVTAIAGKKTYRRGNQ